MNITTESRIEILRKIMNNESHTKVMRQLAASALLELIESVY